MGVEGFIGPDNQSGIERPADPPVTLELRVFVKDTYTDVVSPQLPGASSVGGSDTAAIGNFIKTHGARLGVRVVYE